MTRRILRLIALACILLLLCLDAASSAPPSGSNPVPQARTYLSPTGGDSNGCTASSPCKTLQAAVNMTLQGGEVFVLESGSYGSASITKGIAITSEGALAGAGSITISVGSSEDVHLRGLDIDGASASAIGVQFTSGRSLIITKSVVRNFTNAGISVNVGAVFISETQVTANGNNGIAASGSASVVINKSNIALNATGIFASGAPLTVTESIVIFNTFGIAGLNSNMFVRNTLAINNVTAGLRSDRAAISVMGSRIDATLALNGGTIVSYGTNAFTNGGPTSTSPLSYLLDNEGGKLLDNNGQPLIAG